MPSEVEGTHKIGDVSLYTKTWLPDGAPKAKLIFVHGFNDHINRYYEFFPFLAQHGIASYAFDQRGWGRSALNSSDQGLTGPTSLVISDVISFINTQLPSTVPVFVAGHSMGGGEVITLASDPQYESIVPQIRGWILESPFIAFPKGFEPSSIKVFVGRLASKLLPRKKLLGGLPPENLSRDPAVIQSMKDDKLLHGTGTLEGLSGMLDRTALLGSGQTKLNKGIQSLWIGFGTEDKGTSYEACKKWFDEQTDVQDKHFKSYEGWYHQLHADSPDNREVYAKDVLDFILERVEGGGRGDGSKL